MSTVAEKKTNIFGALRNIFSSEAEIEGELPPELKSALKALEKKEKEVGKYIVAEKILKEEQQFNIDKVINANTRKAMNNYLEKQEKNKGKSDKEIAD